MQEPDNRTIARIERVLKNDIYWIVKYGPGFSPFTGAKKNGVWNSEWPSSISENSCSSVCAIGSYCIHRQPKFGRRTSYKYPPDVQVFARDFKLDKEWTWQVYLAVAEQHTTSPNDFSKGFDLARRLVIYGRSLMQDRENLRHEAGQEAQEYAESRHWA